MHQFAENLIKVKKFTKDWVEVYKRCSQILLKEIEKKISSLFEENEKGVLSKEEITSLKSLESQR
jgi:hypothetical protein